MDDFPDYSVVIPAFNEEELIGRTIASVKAAMASVLHLKGEILVTDNNSTDQTARIAAEQGAKVVFEPFNQIARARNTGANEARGRYLVFIDADTCISGQLLQEALTALDQGNVCGGGARIGTSDGVTASGRVALRLWNRISQTCLLAAGSFVFCLRSAWSDVGGFPESVYASEELFFSRALRKWGRRRALAFRILTSEVDTSMRKLEWYTPGRLTIMMLQFFFFPWRLRKRKHCALWYTRPNGKRERQDVPVKTMDSRNESL